MIESRSPRHIAVIHLISRPTANQDQHELPLYGIILVRQCPICPGHSDKRLWRRSEDRLAHLELVIFGMRCPAIGNRTIRWSRCELAGQAFDDFGREAPQMMIATVSNLLHAFRNHMPYGLVGKPGIVTFACAAGLCPCPF
jgi:hypothetical protein